MHVGSHYWISLGHSLVAKWRYMASLNIVNIGAGSKPLTEPMLTKIQDAIWHQGPVSMEEPSFPGIDSHVKDKTVERPSYLLPRDAYTGTTSLYWDSPQVSMNERRWWKLNANIMGLGTLILDNGFVISDTKYWLWDIWYWILAWGYLILNICSGFYRRPSSLSVRKDELIDVTAFPDMKLLFGF